MTLIIFITLLTFSAFFSASETAFLSLGKVRLKQIEDSTAFSSKKVLAVLADTHSLLITILIGNELVNIAASSIMGNIFYSRFGEKGVGFSICVMTFILLICGEVTPKMFALAHAKTVALFAAYPISFIKILVRPFHFLLDKSTKAIIKASGLDIQTKKSVITEQEIKELIAIGGSKGVLKAIETKMARNILRLKELNAADIMTPRIDLAGLDLLEPKDELIKRCKTVQYSRMPVYVRDLDNIVGIIYTKDFLLDPSVPLRELIKQPYFIPESIGVDTLLRELQRKSIHMAVVTDEYGVTSGIVTIEDILEVIIGPIRDELDVERPEVRKLDNNVYEADGQAHIIQINDELGTDIDTDEVDTIGGYLTLKMEMIPHPGDSLEIKGYRFTVEEVKRNRVMRIRIEKKEQ